MLPGFFVHLKSAGDRMRLRDGFVWEVERPELTMEVRFNGEIRENWTEDGLKIEHYNYHTVLAVPYDVPVMGYKTNAPATHISHTTMRWLIRSMLPATCSLCLLNLNRAASHR